MHITMKRLNANDELERNCAGKCDAIMFPSMQNRSSSHVHLIYAM